MPEKSNSEGEEMIRSFQLTEHYSRVSVPQSHKGSVSLYYDSYKSTVIQCSFF